MISRGAFPVVTIGEEHEDRLLEAPVDEATSPGGWEFRPAQSLDEALEAWDRMTWGTA